MQIILDLPEDIAASLTPSGGDLSRSALEALAVGAYREQKLSTGQLRRLLGFQSRSEVHGFLKEHGVVLHYGEEDLKHDRQAGDMLVPPLA